jgi:hypothetical protein
MELVLGGARRARVMGNVETASGVSKVVEIVTGMISCADCWDYRGLDIGS